ncbi:hypothetical protein Cgig2_004589 [Carnegiea gigantea]|uniref:Uncharacterized protein n=1 Tax=Carnegiea gigantea TaxID=171969 RepID=A0A9Q1Q9J0_9CARY|nr:hypothetical protein Cgig2_004589 [Carnegiea gigantea]
MDTLRSLMSTVADTITHQVSEQVKKAMDAVGSAQPVPAEGSPHRPEGRSSLRLIVQGREVAWGHPILRRPPPMTAPPRPQNARKYCESHEQSGHATTECRELKKAFHELADKGQIDRFLKRWPRFLQQERTPTPPPPRDEKCSTEIVTIIAVRFGDKNKFKSLEVDFLVVDVPMAYNAINKRPTLHRVKAVGNKGYTSGSPRSSHPSSSDAPASTSKGLVASSSAALPSYEGGINSTSSGSRPSTATRSHSSTKPFARKSQQDLVEVDTGVRAALLIALLLGFDSIGRGLLQLAL